MTGFEPRTSGVGSNRCTNWATTAALLQGLFRVQFFQFLSCFWITFLERKPLFSSWTLARSIDDESLSTTFCAFHFPTTTTSIFFFSSVDQSHRNLIESWSKSSKFDLILLKVDQICLKVDQIHRNPIKVIEIQSNFVESRSNLLKSRSNLVESRSNLVESWPNSSKSDQSHQIRSKPLRKVPAVTNYSGA